MMHYDQLFTLRKHEVCICFFFFLNVGRTLFFCVCEPESENL